MINQITLIDQTILFSRKIAFFTFLIASLLPLVFYYTEFNGMIYFSMLFTISAFIINTYYFLKLLLFFKDNIKRNQILLSLALMLLNIPLGLLYLEIGLKIYSHCNPI